MDVNNANTLSLMRHHVKPQNASMGHVFQRLFFLGFIRIHNQCFGERNPPPNTLVRRELPENHITI